MKAAIAGYCRATGLTEPAGRGRLYAMLDREASCSTDARLRRLRQRRKETGERRRDYMALTKLDAIAVDKGLRVAFEGDRGAGDGPRRAEGRNYQALVNMEKQPGQWGEKPPAGLLYCGG